MTRLWRLLITGLILLAASGCMVNQPKEIQTYRRVINGDRQMTVKPYAPEAPLSLQRALELAAAGNEQLAIAGEDYLQALIDKDRAFANFLPKISFAPAYMRQEKSAIGEGNPLVGSLLPDKTLDLPVTGRLDIDPLKDVPVMNSADLEAKRKRFLLLDSKAVILLDTAQTYYQVLRSERLGETLAHSVTVNKKKLRDTRIRQKAGTATFIDVSQAAAQLASAENDRIKAQNDVDNGRAMLAVMLGVETVDGSLVDTFEAPSSVPQMEALLNASEVHRQDLQATHAAVREAADRLQAAWAEYYPSISLNLSYFFSRESFPNDVNWTALIQANVPIFTAGLAHADVRTAYSRLRQAKLVESKTRRQVAKDLRVALGDFTRDADQIDAYRVQVTAARESAKKAEEAYHAGIGTGLERLVARDFQLKSHMALIDATFKRNMDYLRLLRAEGMLDFEMDHTIPESLPSGTAAREPVNRENNMP